MPETSISSRTVLSALYELHSRWGRWPTADEIATYLEAEETEILEHLRSLKAQRLFRDRRRQGKRVWIPWERS